MPKIPNTALQEILFGSSDRRESYALSSLEKKGLIRKIAPKIYTSNLEEVPESIIRRNWYKILSNLYPDALLSHRTALEYQPTKEGMLYVTYNYKRTVSFPGLTIEFIKGPGRINGDAQWYENIYVSQEPRAYLENMQQVRKGENESKVLPQSEIEKKLDTIIKVHGEEALNSLRDKARELSVVLEMPKEFQKLNKLISALLSTHPSGILSSAIAKARVLGEPFDPDRIQLFETMYNVLAKWDFPYYADANIKPPSYRNFAFFESYFSNYIEGTEFEIGEAKQIIETGVPMPDRDEDSHDILGTYQLVSDLAEMRLLPTTPKDFIQLLKRRHAVLLQARTSKKPGSFKNKNNRAGATEFVDLNLVVGTLKKGLEWYMLLRHPFARAAYIMFIVSEVHPFLDGNGRIARVMMNAELSSQGLSKIIIPTVYREDYIGVLKKLTKQRNPDAYIRMLLRAWEFSASISQNSVDEMQTYLESCYAFDEPKEAKLHFKEKITAETK